MRKPKNNEKIIEHKASAPHGLKECPIFITLELIANKWSVRILYALLHADAKTLRFGELQRAMGGITQRELSKHLRGFEAAGLVNRKVYPQVPPRVEYTLTALGESLWKPIDALSDWAEKNAVAIQKSRQKFEAKRQPS